MYITRRKQVLKYKILFIFIFLMSTSIIGFLYIDREITPTVQAIGDLKAQELTTRAVNQAMSFVLEQGIEYKDLISIKEDHEGNITMMQANA